ncbi:hypothetical protein CAAN1_02S01332 [[Candida] anglica]|uniref:Glutathione S-transferase n=1 Tax=[Candida] anglica TaxID=148631 RepID=A0ABP0E6I8_9ASCO
MVDKIILHWLDGSRAQRIVWLLNELNVPFEVKPYKRKNFRAPRELREVFPLGRAPIVEIFPDGDETEEPIVLAETGYIINYLIENYDKEKKLIPTSRKDQELVKYYLYYAEGSLQSILIALLVNSKVAGASPFGLKYIAGVVTQAINKGYYLPELKSNLKFLDDRLSKVEGDYFVGNKLTGADIILSFPLVDNLFSDVTSTKEFTGLDVVTLYPNIKRWSDKIKLETNRSDALLQVKNLSPNL